MDTIVDIVVDNYSRLQPLFKNSIIYKIKRNPAKPTSERDLAGFWRSKRDLNSEK